MKKKLYSIILASSLAVMLSACGEDTEKTNVTPSNSNEANQATNSDNGQEALTDTSNGENTNAEKDDNLYYLDDFTTEDLTRIDFEELEVLYEGKGIELPDSWVWADEEKECVNIIMKAIIEADWDTIKNYTEESNDLKMFFKSLEETTNEDVNNYYKKLISYAVYVEEEDYFLMKNRDYMTAKFINDYVQSDTLPPDVEGYSYSQILKLHEELDLFNKYYVDAPYEIVIMGVTEKLTIRRDDNGKLVAYGMEEIIDDVFYGGLGDEYYNPMELIVDDAYLNIDSDIERIKSEWEAYKPVREKDFDTLYNMFKEYAKENEVSAKFINEYLLNEDGTENSETIARMKEFFVNNVEYYMDRQLFYEMKQDFTDVTIYEREVIGYDADNNIIDVRGLDTFFKNLEEASREE